MPGPDGLPDLPQGGAGAERADEAGHHWKDPERVRTFVARMDRRRVTRRQRFDELCAILDTGPAPRAVLDLGTGYGALAKHLLDRYPDATATGVDVSQPMMRRARRRMRRYGERFELVECDMALGALDPLRGRSFDAVVSSLAIHHLHPPAKARLFRECLALLRPGGWFLNLDYVVPEDPEVEAVMRAVGRGTDPVAARAGSAPTVGEDGTGRAHRHAHEHPWEPLAGQLTALRSAGFGAVGCYCRCFRTTLYGGRRPG